MPQQSRRKNLDVVDHELLMNKQNKKVFKGAAYSMGLGVGLLLLIPILPDIDETAKQDGLESIFVTISCVLIANSFALAFGFFLLRPYIGLIQFMLSWFVMPTVGIWAVVEGYKVIAG